MTSEQFALYQEAHGKPALFDLGRPVMTPGGMEALESAEQIPAAIASMFYVQRHQTGDWGVTGEFDSKENAWSVKNGERILSAYDLHIPEGPDEGELAHIERIWIITERDRSATTILLPSEY